MLAGKRVAMHGQVVTDAGSVHSPKTLAPQRGSVLFLSGTTLHQNRLISMHAHLSFGVSSSTIVASGAKGPAYSPSIGLAIDNPLLYRIVEARCEPKARPKFSPLHAWEAVLSPSRILGNHLAIRLDTLPRALIRVS